MDTLLVEDDVPGVVFKPPPPVVERRPGTTEPAGHALAVPAGPDRLADHYDLTVSRPDPGLVQFAAFDRWLAGAAAERGLSCAVLHDGVVHEALHRLGLGTLTVGYHLDYYALWHVAEDPYARLAQAVQDAGGCPVNSPARSRAFTDKATAHAELIRHGIGVPATVVVRPWAADRTLTAAERAELRLEEPGARVYLKPANGYGSRGVVRLDRVDADGLLAGLKAARDRDRRECYLVQREVRGPRLACDDGVERPAYWRVLYCLGNILPFSWDGQASAQGRASYQWLSPGEMRRHRLRALWELVRELADVTGLEWFSTEVCLSDGPEPSRYTVPCLDGRVRPLVAIDYVNDQCDVDVQSRWAGGPPDDLVQYVAGRFAEEAARCRRRSCGANPAVELARAA